VLSRAFSGLSILSFALLALLSGVHVAAAEPAADALSPGAQLAQLATQYDGSPYRWGGTSPAGFDCSGFVLFVYSQFGIGLPHSEAGQLSSGPRVGLDELQPGDVLVFANTYRRGLSHVGIYLGEGRFEHAVDERHGVMTSNLGDGYWASRLVGASRPLAA
jgi:peptidoglycan endopeptidase LytE